MERDGKGQRMADWQGLGSILAREGLGSILAWEESGGNLTRQGLGDNRSGKY